MPQLEVNGTHLHFQTLGHGEPVVMIHGLLVGNLASWYFGAASQLSKDHEVLAYDLRGHGLSEKSPEGYDLQTMGLDLAGLIHEKYPEGKVSIVGHSYGALLALHYALNHPSKVSKLVLVEAPLPPSKAAQIDSFNVKTAEELLEALPKQLREVIMAQKRQALKFLERIQFLLFETHLLENLRTESDVADTRLQTLQIPTLLVYSRESSLASVGERLASVLPNARLEWMDGGHYLPSERPQELTHKIMEFFH